MTESVSCSRGRLFQVGDVVRQTLDQCALLFVVGGVADLEEAPDPVAAAVIGRLWRGRLNPLRSEVLLQVSEHLRRLNVGHHLKGARPPLLAG